MVAVNRRYGQLYTQADYDCQECGKPETDAMLKKRGDFVHPTCEECIDRLAHEGHRVPGLMASIQHVSIVLGPDGRPEEKRKEWKVRYRDWDGRCFKCFPVHESKGSSR